jgi:predicted MPP superfamily phosphohydrolase
VKHHRTDPFSDADDQPVFRYRTSRLSAAREVWRDRRVQMEADGRRFTRHGTVTTGSLPTLLTRTVEHAVSVAGLRQRALRNLRDIELSEAELFFPHLPHSFDGYTILHLTDLHVGRVPGLLSRAAERIRGLSVDLAVLTGDFQTWGTPHATAAVAGMAALVATIDARDGIFGVLGNHDTQSIVDPLESIGVRMLINEHLSVIRDDQSILLTGLDDVNYFYSQAAADTLCQRPATPFAISLVHSPEVADIAAEAGYALYLSGHTHGGQICLPNRRPIFTALDYHHKLASGIWQYGQMLGYTSRGIGVGRRARFNCRPEISLLRLRRERS